MNQDHIELRPSDASASPHLRRQLSGLGVLLLALSSLSPVLSAYGHRSGALVLSGIGVALVFGVV